MKALGPGAGLCRQVERGQRRLFAVWQHVEIAKVLPGAREQVGQMSIESIAEVLGVCHRGGCARVEDQVDGHTLRIAIVAHIGCNGREPRVTAERGERHTGRTQGYLGMKGLEGDHQVEGHA